MSKGRDKRKSPVPHAGENDRTPDDISLGDIQHNPYLIVQKNHAITLTFHHAGDDTRQIAWWLISASG